jgi:integrase
MGEEEMSVFVRGGSPFWQYDFILNGKRYCGTTKIRSDVKGSKERARKFERGKMLEAETGTYHKRNNGSQTLKDFIAERLLPAIAVECADKPRTIEFYKSNYDKISEDPIAKLSLNEITKADVTDFKVRMRKDLAVATTNRRLASLRKALRRAVEEELIPKSPKVEMLDGERKRDYVLLGPEKEIFVAGMPAHLRNPVEFLFETGLRITELCTLTKDRVSFDGPFPFIKIHRSVSKSKDDRFVPLTLRAQEIIVEEMNRSRSNYVFVRWGRGVLGNKDGATKPEGKLEHAFVFPLIRHTISAAFTARRKEMSLPDDVVLHSTRHSAATLIGAKGTVDIFTMMSAFGWRSPNIAKRYVHPTPETLAKAFLGDDMGRNLRPAKLPTVIEGKMLIDGK